MQRGGFSDKLWRDVNPIARIQRCIGSVVCFGAFACCCLIGMFVLGIILIFSPDTRGPAIAKYNTAVNDWKNGGMSAFDKLNVQAFVPATTLSKSTVKDKNHINPRSGENIELTYPVSKLVSPSNVHFFTGLQPIHKPGLEFSFGVGGDVRNHEVPLFKTKVQDIHCFESEGRCEPKKCANTYRGVWENEECLIVSRLTHVCFAVNPQSKTFESVEGNGKFGCLAKNGFDVGTYTQINYGRMNRTYSSSGSIMVRSSEDPFVQLNVIAGSSLSFGATQGEKRVLGTMLLFGSIAPFCCSFVITVALVFLIVILVRAILSTKKQNSGFAPMAQPQQPYPQQPQYQPQPGFNGMQPGYNQQGGYQQPQGQYYG